MEPHPCSDRDGAVLDTGQRQLAAPDGAASAPASAPASAATDKLTGGCNQDGPKNAPESTDEALGEASGQAAEETHSESSSPAVSLQEKTGEECAGSDGAVNIVRGSAECSEENAEMTDVCEFKSVTPIIVIEHDSAESGEGDNSNDDDMDPLITIDDTESQSSDLINFDTVSYDVMCQHGGEDDDDEKSIATLSSLSCDIKVDSPSKHSQASNSSGLSNLLDSSIKETLGLAVNPSAPLTDGAGSAASSCPSSPSLQSSKTVSSAVDESISEAFMNVLQISEADEARLVNCDSKVLSEKDSEDSCRVESEESACAVRPASPQSVDVFRNPNPVEETIDIQCGDLVLDSDGAEEMSCPAVENLSHSNAENNLRCSPNESNIELQMYDGDHNISESLNVPEISILNSPEDDIDMHKEDTVNSSPEIREPEPSALLTPNENDNQKFHEEENEVNSAVMSSSLLTGNHVNHPTDSGVQDSNDNLVGICEGEDIISFMLHPDSPAKVPEISQNISSTSIEEIMSISTSNNVDINVALSSSTEDDIHFSTGSHDEALVSSTSNEDNSCSAPVVSSILENEANGTEEHISSQTSIVNENIPLEENISSSSASLVSGEDISVDTSEKITTNIMDSQNIEDVSNCSQVARTPSPADSALSMSNCVTSEESLQRMSCDSSNGTMELISLEAINGDLSSTSDGLSVPAGNINDGFQANGDLTQSATVMLDSNAKNSEPVESPNSGNVVESPLSEGSLSEEVMNNAQECSNVNFSARSQLDEDLKENSDSISSHAETGFPNESGSFETVERPTTLPEINQNKPSPEKSSGMNFSEFLDLFNMSNKEGLSKPKQYDVATLDEAQQIASLLVDDIIQMAMIKVEEKLTSSESLIEDRVEAVQVAQILVDGVLSEAHASIVDVGKAEISTICDIKDSGSHHPASSSATVDVHSQVTGNILSTEPCLVSFPESIVNITEELPDPQRHILNISEDVCEAKTEPSQEESQAIADENLTCIAETTPNINSDSTSDIVNISEDNSLSDSLVDGQSKDSVRTSSTENAGADLSRSSLLTTSDLGLRSEASLFVDGVLQEAVKKYEESSSSETSPVKIRSLALDSEFFQEDEELATPCGEMLTEHFMDFESGRNVSVFCSIPENRNEDHLLAYDRVAHTIGNREVDSDTGKSLSVFRIEEDVFYEIQRASTCTSVFESVEEEDEDMIDTTIPVEERPEKTLSTSASFPSYDKEKFGTSDDPFSADCDAFEDAVGAFLTKERLAHNELRNRAKSDFSGATEQQSEVTCRALVLRHPEIDISNSDEKKRMAEKWANGVPDTPEMREKQKAIKEALDSDDDVAVKLCRLALTEGGLINDALRREAWPRMLGLDPTLEVNAPSLEDLKSHPEYEQVVLDVNRSLKRFPPDIPKDHRETLQDKLTRLIMYVISKHPHLRYYQGYHDVAVTFLLVVGESIAFQIMERLSTEHLSDCMQPTMERTSYLLHFIYPLLHRLHPTLADYLERSEVGTMFCLPWFLTWFGHSLDHYKDVVRLYDHFLASPPLAPLYVAAVLVAHRADEVLAVDCDMAAIHALLSHIPDSLPLEILLRDATELYMKFPPQSIEREVEERFRNEQETEARERVRALRRRHAHRTASGTWQLAEIQDRIGGSMMVLNRWMPPWVVQQQRLSMRLLFASATFFVGFYVYSRGGDMLPYP